MRKRKGVSEYRLNLFSSPNKSNGTVTVPGARYHHNRVPFENSWSVMVNDDVAGQIQESIDAIEYVVFNYSKFMIQKYGSVQEEKLNQFRQIEKVALDSQFDEE